MKRIIISAFMLMLIHGAYAQHVQFGIKGGVNFANLRNDAADESADARTGFHVGGLAHIHITRAFAVQPEIVYSTQGAEYGNDKLKLNYINVPVLAQYMFANGFRLQTGPQLGILTTSEYESGNTESDVDDLSNADFSWIFGASYVGRMGLGVDARYNLGLTDVSKSRTTDLQNRVWQIGLFYQFKPK
ncbi:PorT family protein [Niastella caeni]|uniref:PorT family protein n=1 Tax=Niastella caeni TaxID=2569763 RepID=A0A4S8HGA5_9BACT|nr:porin family protein [Niastella caeni]THU34188.1 PorT family protein [Niastella caeni]